MCASDKQINPIIEYSIIGYLSFGVRFYPLIRLGCLWHDGGIYQTQCL
jgi:hypothetical protein